MSFFYSKEDETSLNDALDDINEQVRKGELRHAPNQQDRQVMTQMILDFVSKKNRVIYGGYALNMLICKASNNRETIYSKIDFPDVEFYTPSLKADVRDICDLFYTKFNNVTAEEGVHPATFVVKVEFVNVLDVTFIPLPLFETIPSVKIRGVNIVSPEFAMVDIFRVYSFPINNFFRLHKTFTRANLLLKYYPLSFKENPQKGSPSGKEVFEYLVKNKVFSDKMILTCQTAQNLYCREAGIPEDEIVLPIIAVSVSYDNDIKRLRNLLKGNTRSFLPFTELLGRKTVFTHEGRDMLMVIEQQDMCLSFIKARGLKITTTQSTAFFTLCLVYQNMVHKRQKEVKFFRRVMQRLTEAKRSYFQKNTSKKVTSPGIFQEFVVDCEGEAVSVFRKFGMERRKRIKDAQVIKYRYTPEEDIKSRSNRTFLAMNTFETLGQEESARKK